MANYIGVRCPVCEKKFIQADDVVVCPKCGAPHHRECYAKEGDCAFAAEHITGKVWSNPEAAVETPVQRVNTQPVRCDRCNAYNPREMPFCQVCGTKLNPAAPRQQQPQPQPEAPEQWPQSTGFDFSGSEFGAGEYIYGGIDPEETIGGETVRDLAFFIGVKPGYFLQRFKMFAETGRQVSANWSALILGFLYFFYRKMYKIGTILLVLFLISMIPRLMYAYYYTPVLLNQWGMWPEVAPDEAMVEFCYNASNIAVLVQFIATVAASLFANRLYYNQVIPSVKAARESNAGNTDQQVYLSKISALGGVSFKSVGLVILLLTVLYFVASIGVALALLNG